MLKKNVSTLLIPLLLVATAVPLTAKGDGSKAGSYDNSTTRSHTDSTTTSHNEQSSGVLSNDSAATSNDGVRQQPNTQQPGVGSDMGTPVSSAQRNDVAPGALQKEGVAFQPVIGMMNYRNTDGIVSNRATYGILADTNLARYVSDSPDLYIGPQIGFVFSHLGPSNADFFGSTPSDQAANGAPGANGFFIPTDLKIGYNLGDFRPAIHGGGNLFYRSVGSSLAVSSTPDTSSGGVWTYAPNIGLDLELALARNIAIVARPDLTFGGSNPIWQASLGASIPLG